MQNLLAESEAMLGSWSGVFWISSKYHWFVVYLSLWIGREGHLKSQ